MAAFHEAVYAHTSVKVAGWTGSTIWAASCCTSAGGRGTRPRVGPRGSPWASVFSPKCTLHSFILKPRTKLDTCIGLPSCFVVRNREGMRGGENKYTIMDSTCSPPLITTPTSESRAPRMLRSLIFPDPSMAIWSSTIRSFECTYTLDNNVSFFPPQ